MTQLRHILSVEQFDQSFLDDIFDDTDRAIREISDKGSIAQTFAGHYMNVFFYEPSTRTRCSFVAAGHQLGLKVDVTDSAGNFSSAVKGETIEDSMQVISGYDPLCIVLRNPTEGDAERAAAVSLVPIINGGDGAGEHPTQALLDLYTIRREFGRTDNLRVLFVGDCRFGRTTHSLAKLLAHQPGVKLATCTPEKLRMPSEVCNYTHSYGKTIREFDDLTIELLQGYDVVYVVRLQKERFSKKKRQSFAATYERFRLTFDMVINLDPGMRILHPLPKVDEIEDAVSNLPQAAYFRQAMYGLPIRVSLLRYVGAQQLKVGSVFQSLLHNP